MSIVPNAIFQLQEGVPDLTTPEQLTRMISLVKDYQEECAKQGWHRTEVGRRLAGFVLGCVRKAA